MEYSQSWFYLKNKVAIVTGGNTGIGFGYVDALSKAGADIMVSYFEGDITETKKIVENNGQKIAFWKGDLTKKQSPEDLVKATLKEFGKIDILVNNAGITERDPILEHSLEKWNKVMDINLTTVFSLSKAVGKVFLKQKGGKIINVASMRSFQAGMGNPGYTSSKHGIIGLTKSFANELAIHNIQVNAIAPGYIVSNFTIINREDPNRNKNIISRIPNGRWGTPDDLKGTIVFLSSNASNYINGATICVDGGFQIR